MVFFVSLCSYIVVLCLCVVNYVSFCCCFVSSCDHVVSVCSCSLDFRIVCVFYGHFVSKFVSTVHLWLFVTISYISKSSGFSMFSRFVLLVCLWGFKLPQSIRVQNRGQSSLWAVRGGGRHFPAALTWSTTSCSTPAVNQRNVLVWRKHRISPAQTSCGTLWTSSLPVLCCSLSRLLSASQLYSTLPMLLNAIFTSQTKTLHCIILYQRCHKAGVYSLVVVWVTSPASHPKLLVVIVQTWSQNET